MNNLFGRNGLLWIGVAMVLGIGLVGAQDAPEDHLEKHALRYSGMVERAYGRLYGFIRDDSTTVTSWSGAAVPPASSGWDSVWTDVGVRARYCDDMLLVYMGAVEPKGVGGDHRAIQSARRRFLSERESGVRLPMLGWLESGEVTDSQGGTITLPGCISSDYTESLPSGRAALAGTVVDPWTDLRTRVSYENRESVCPAGEHGELRERREITQEFNAKGDLSGSPVLGPWVAAPGSWCKPDYTYFEVYTDACSWYQGEPFNRTMNGIETWRIPIVVSAKPGEPGEVIETGGSPEFVSSTCWDGPPPLPPTPTTTAVNLTESRTGSCGAGFTGSIGEARVRTTTTTTYPWGGSPLVSVEYSSWSETSNTCTAICPPPCGDGPEGGDGPGGPASDTGNTGAEDPSEFGGTGQAGDNGFGGSPGNDGDNDGSDPGSDGP